MPPKKRICPEIAAIELAVKEVLKKDSKFAQLRQHITTNLLFKMISIEDVLYGLITTQVNEVAYQFAIKGNKSLIS